LNQRLNTACYKPGFWGKGKAKTKQYSARWMSIKRAGERQRSDNYYAQPSGSFLSLDASPAGFDTTLFIQLQAS
jgi:hypothetical protein